MALAQITQAVATWYLMNRLIEDMGFKWTLAIGAGAGHCCMRFTSLVHPRLLMILCQPLHGLAYVFFIIAGQICANAYATAGMVGSMQALIFAATTGVGMFLGTQFAGIVMDKNSVDGKFLWRKIWAVPCLITVVGVLVLAAIFTDPAAGKKADAPAGDAPPVSARDLEQG